MLTQVLEAGSDAHLADAMQRNKERSSLELSSLESSAGDEEVAEDDLHPGLGYLPPDSWLLDCVPDPAEDIASECQLQLNRRLNPARISTALCASVLAYDVLGLIVCFQWASVAMRIYSVLFGRLASAHDALYMLSCLVYAITVVVGLSRFVFAFCPSAEELATTSDPKDND